MRKLKLDLENLDVTSFATDESRETRGTVQGHKPPTPTYQTCAGQQWTCGCTQVGDYTCDFTCNVSCRDFCNNTMLTIECGSCPNTTTA